MKNDLIIDVGMHRGEDTEYYLKKGFNVVAVEANPELCEQVDTRLSGYTTSGQLTILNAAVVENPGSTKFYINDNVSEWSTAQKSWVERNDKMGTTSREVTVKGVTFEQVLSEYGVPYLLKIDIEGNDVLCLEALKTQSSTPEHISIESDKVSWKNLLYEFDLFKSLGYDQFKVVNQFFVPDQVSPNPPREGVFLESQFPFGSSGHFGNEAPGRWLSQSLALAKYRWIFLKYRLLGDNGIFPEVHRHFPKNSRLKRILHAYWYDTHASKSEIQ